MLKVNITLVVTHYLYSKEKSRIIKSIYDLFFIQSPPKQLSLSGVLFNYIIRFATYHPYYKEKLRMIVSIQNINLFYKSDYLVASFFYCNNSVCTTELGLVKKKRELSKTPSIYIIDIQNKSTRKAKSLSLLFSLMFFKICLAISNYSIMSNYVAILKGAIISKLQLNLILVSLSLLTDYLSVQLISEKSIRQKK